MFLKYCSVTLFLTGDYGGHGNSYHATGGRGNKRAQMRHCLRLLRSMCSTEDEAILQDLSDQGAISQITSELPHLCYIIYHRMVY